MNRSALIQRAPHVGAQADAARAATVTQRADHAGARNAFVHLQSEQAQGGSHYAGGAALLEGKFRMCVQIAPQRYEFREQIFDGSHTVSQRPASTASANSANVRKW